MENTMDPKKLSEIAGRIQNVKEAEEHLQTELKLSRRRNASAMYTYTGLLADLIAVLPDGAGHDIASRVPWRALRYDGASCQWVVSELHAHTAGVELTQLVRILGEPVDIALPVKMGGPAAPVLLHPGDTIEDVARQFVAGGGRDIWGVLPPEEG